MIIMQRKRGAWTIRKSIVKYRTPWVTVVEDHGTQPDGKLGMHVRVKVKDGISVLAVDAKGYIYLIKGFHYAEGTETVEVVSGAIDPGEQPLASAKRELREELGITARKWTSLGKINPHTTVLHAYAHLYLARVLSFGKRSQEGTENLKLLKVKLDRAVEMVLRDKIIHGPSALLILWAHEYLRKKRHS